MTQEAFSKTWWRTSSRRELNSTIRTEKPKKIQHLGVSASRETDLKMRLCSRFEGAFVRIEMTLLTPEYMS